MRKTRLREILPVLFVLGGMVGTGCEKPAPPPVEQRSGALNAYCTATVNGVGQRDVETDYLPHVITCENGAAPLEALKAQAVAARSYLYYKLDSSGAINDGTSDQVYSCSATPGALHHQAVQETAGQVLTYGGHTICAFYVAGGIPSATGCVYASGDSDPTNTEHYVTYNWNLSGANIEQTSLGWVNSGNVYNRGCKSQNGATCLANQGWGYQDILRFYYGMDIGLETATGSCVDPPTECTAGAEETRDCERCGVETRTCDAAGSWGAWGTCEQQGVCEPGAEESDSCGDCGLWTRTCDAGCNWGEWGACTSVQTDAPCDTGVAGECAAGRFRCVEAQLLCEPLVSSALELCDDLDNDCNGEVDEGIPPVLGETPPALAAELNIVTAPLRVEPGATEVVVLRVANVGQQDWAAGDLVLRAVGGGGTSALYSAGGWESTDTVLTLNEAVAAGSAAELRFLISIAAGSTTAAEETFWLYTAAGAPVPCPAPAVTLGVEPDGTVDTGRPDAGPGVDPGERVVSGCGCGQGRPAGLLLPGLLLLGLLLRRRVC